MFKGFNVLLGLFSALIEPFRAGLPFMEGQPIRRLRCLMVWLLRVRSAKAEHASASAALNLKTVNPHSGVMNCEEQMMNFNRFFPVFRKTVA